MSVSDETAVSDGIILSDAAAEKVRNLLEQEGRDDLALRVAVQPGGCSGLRYQLFFDERSLDGDLVNDFDGVEVVAPEAMTKNGHCSYLPGNRWILNDTYPDEERHQELYLYSLGVGRRYDLGRFFAPPEYTGEWRCDLHPRFSPDGHKVIVDSAHGGDGRQLYLIDIGEIVSNF
jgi:iron-sulfur cluster assembly accessory protein